MYRIPFAGSVDEKGPDDRRDGPDEEILSDLFDGSRRHARWHAMVARIAGRPYRLPSLSEALRGCMPSGSHFAGLRTVPIRAIRGSENHHVDFDDEFRPLEKRMRARWLSVAAALMGGEALPPVALIQVGETYYVRDGHHRISAARAAGQQHIEALVTALEVSPLPPRAGSSACGRSFRSAMPACP